MLAVGDGDVWPKADVETMVEEYEASVEMLAQEDARSLCSREPKSDPVGPMEDTVVANISGDNTQ
eukprot:6301027-Lingulodinium_polyedra.AAC.1